MTPHPLAERDPAPEQPWQPASHAWARRAALEATKQAIAAAKDARKKPTEEVAE